MDGCAGIEKFTDLTLGLYLMVQHTNVSGYYALNPFLVTAARAHRAG